MSSEWKKSFLDKLGQAQSQWIRRFEDSLESAVTPVFDELKTFLAENGFHTSAPLRELGRRSYKFELAENAYLLTIFRSLGVGEFEVRFETFVPGSQPVFRKSVVRITDVDAAWARGQFQSGLDAFVELLAGEKRKEQQGEKASPAKSNEELVTV